MAARCGVTPLHCPRPRFSANPDDPDRTYHRHPTTNKEADREAVYYRPPIYTVIGIVIFILYRDIVAVSDEYAADSIRPCSSYRGNCARLCPHTS